MSNQCIYIYSEDASSSPYSRDMHNLLFSVEDARRRWKASKKNEWAVPKKACWGCGKEEKDEQFKCCSKCVQLGMVPARFCSQSCFKDSWPRHKAWHKEFKNHTDDVKRKITSGEGNFINTNGNKVSLAELGLENFNLNMDDIDLDNDNDNDADDDDDYAGVDIASLKPPFDYDALTGKAENFFHVFDFNNAMKGYRKAIKNDPRRPEAYMSTGLCLRACKEFDQSVRYLEFSIERWALTSLTRHLGGGTINVDRDYWALNSWAEIVYLLCQDYFSVDFKHRRKPDWFKNDQVLIKVTRIAVDCFKKNPKMIEKKLRQMTIFYATALGGLFSGGNLKKDISGLRRTPEELEEAAKQFYQISQMAGPDSATHKNRSQQLIYLSQCCKNDRGPVAISLHQPLPMFKGAWVTLKDLTSDAGRKLNSKLGLIKRIDENTKCEVQVEGVQETKLFKEKNLKLVPMTDTAISLVATLDLDSQWVYMKEFRNKVEKDAIAEGYGTPWYNLKQCYATVS